MRGFDEGDRTALIALWTACDLVRPWNDPNRDIDRKLGQDPAGLIVLDVGSLLVGAVMVGYDGHRGWINYLAVHPDHRRHGHGARLMAAAEAHLEKLGVPRSIFRSGAPTTRSSTSTNGSAMPPTTPSRWESASLKTNRPRRGEFAGIFTNPKGRSALSNGYGRLPGAMPGPRHIGT